MTPAIGDVRYPLPERSERCCASGACAERQSHIRRQPRRNRGNQFYLDRAPNGAEATLCGLRPTCRDLSWPETRHASNRKHVECSTCAGLREVGS